MLQRGVMHDIRGEDFREAREAAGLTQEDVSERFQVHRTTVIRWEQRALLPVGRAADILRELQELAARPAA